MNTGRCSEELLHGYADGRLSATEHARVEAWLAVHPEDRQRVAAWRANDELLRRAYDAAVAGPIPERLLQAAERPRAPGLRIAAALGWLALGLAGGYALRDLTAPPAIDRIASLPRDAAVAHAVYAPEVRLPVVGGADQEAHHVGGCPNASAPSGRVRPATARATGWWAGVWCRVRRGRSPS
jgi:anti-sigma factor RsiW